jgi:hypothetical protein
MPTDGVALLHKGRPNPLRVPHSFAMRSAPVRGVAQPGSASGLGPEGRRFESCLPDHYIGDL